MIVLLHLGTLLVGIYGLFYPNIILGSLNSIFMILISFLFLGLFQMLSKLKEYGKRLNDLITQHTGAPPPSSPMKAPGMGKTDMYSLGFVTFLVGLAVLLFGLYYPKYLSGTSILIMLMAFAFFGVGEILAEVILYGNNLNHLASHIARATEAERKIGKLRVYGSEAARRKFRLGLDG